MIIKIAVTGGGTGGHVFPALAIAEELRKRSVQVEYVGTAQGMEARLVPPKGFAFHALKTGAVKNQNLLKIFKSIGSLLTATVWSIQFIQKNDIRAVVGVGGYVSVPMCLAAFILRRPIFLQEQNASVGIANRFLGKLAVKIFLGFKAAEKYFHPKKCLWTGNPIRAEFQRTNFKTYNPETNSLFIFGGSQGSRAINDAFLNVLPALLERCPEIKIVHQTGEKEFERVQELYKKVNVKNLELLPFINDMDRRYEEASLVISRSGALSVSELIAVKRPALLVPFPRVGQNDQVDNAKYLEHHHVAVVIEQGESFPVRFAEALLKVFLPSELKKMARGFSALHTPSGLATIGDHIMAGLNP